MSVGPSRPLLPTPSASAATSHRDALIKWLQTQDPDWRARINHASMDAFATSA